MLPLCTPLKTALIALIKDLTVPSDFVYGYSDILGEKKRTWVWAMSCFLLSIENWWEILRIFLLYTVLPGGTKGSPSSLRWSLKSPLNPHLAQLDISSLYILKLMENSAAVCDNYQPAPEDKGIRKGRLGGGGEVSRWRRERLKWEEDVRMKSLEKKSSSSLVFLVGTPFSLPFPGQILCGFLVVSLHHSPHLPPLFFTS